MKGVLEFLTGDSEDAIFLRNNFIIKVIPMLNPDGVICGNFRTSVSGHDLNRKWREPSKLLYPEVFHSKEISLKMSKERTIDLLIDLHGHSGEYNVFIYGNVIKNNSRDCKLYPYSISKLSDYFYYSLCKFKMQNFKRGTARISLFREIGPVPNIVCVEASAAGTNSGKFKNLHWSCINLMKMGKDLLKGYINYMNITGHSFIKSNNIDKSKANKELDDLEEEIQQNNELVGKTNSDSESGGSDSEPSIDNYDEDQLMKLMPGEKKKAKTKNKSKKKQYLTTSKVAKIVTNKLNNMIKNNNLKVKSSEKTIAVAKPKLNIQQVTSEKKPTAVPKINFNINININKVAENVITSNKNTNKNSINYNQDTQRDKISTITNNKISFRTQTEDIFFKLPWSFFKNKYKILSANNLKSNKTTNRNELLVSGPTAKVNENRLIIQPYPNFTPFIKNNILTNKNINFNSPFNQNQKSYSQSKILKQPQKYKLNTNLSSFTIELNKIKSHSLKK